MASTVEWLGSLLMASSVEIERKVRQLPWWPRAICWAFGIGFGGIGTYAVFVTDNQAGTAALLILSALFSIVALTGRVPQRLQFGENSVEWPSELTDVVTTAIEEGPPEVAEKVVSTPSGVVPDRIISIATDRLTGLSAERIAQATLMLAAIQLEDETGDTFNIVSHFGDDMCDFHVVRQNRDDRHVHDEVPVAVKRVGRLSAEFVRKLAVYADQSFFKRVILIQYGDLTHRSMQLLAEAANIYVVQIGRSVNVEESLDRIKQCLRAAFQLTSDLAD